MENQTIYAFIKEKENRFQTDEVQVGENMYWNLRKHVQMIFHLKNGYFYTGNNDYLRAFKNIMEPILHLSYWTEDIEVKDVQFSIEEDNNRVLSFLIKKYHDEIYTREHNIDEMIDDVTESDLDYGGVLIQNAKESPEVLALNSIAFCDQTDMLGSPIGFRLNFSPDKLRGMAKYGWGDPKNGATTTIDELCVVANQTKIASGTQDTQENQVPGKQIEVYIVRGAMPDIYLDDNNDGDEWINQLQIVAFYTDRDNHKQGVTLYRKEDDGENIKFFASQKVYGRALGRGTGEAVIHPQIWTNFLEIHKMNMLESASKVPLYTDDQSYTTKNRIQDMENLEITRIEDGKRIYQVPTAAPANVQLLQNAVNEWYDQAQLSGSAFDPIMGKEPPSGTTFRGQERNVAQGKGLHERRLGQRAKFIEEIYKDWIIPQIVKEITKGTKFLASLSLDEMSWVAENLSINQSNQAIIDKVLTMKAEDITADNIQALQQLQAQTKVNFLRSGNKQVLEILKEDFKDIEIKVNVNVANKQKDMGVLISNIDNIIKTIMSNPYMLKAEPLGQLFNRMVEAIGLPPIDLSKLDVPMPLPMRRVTESIDYADLPPDAQQAMLAGAGIQVQPQAPQSPQPNQQPNPQPNQQGAVQPPQPVGK